MAGRPRKPTALKELAGTAQPCRSNPNEPRPTIGVPDMPTWLVGDPTALSIYEQCAGYLAEMKVGTSADGIGVSMLADQLAIYIDLREQVRREGAVIELEGSSGQVKKVPHPALAPMNTAFANIHKMLREYGLTAASRSSVDAQLEKEVSTFDDFMNI